MRKRKISGCLAVLLLSGSLVGCNGISQNFKSEEVSEVQVKLNETISSDSKWINSSMNGAIDENTAVNEADDFYTYANKDWILQMNVDPEKQLIVYGNQSGDITYRRMVNIITNTPDDEANGNVPLSEETRAQYEKVVSIFGNAVSDWDTRNSQGVEPLKQYIQYIQDIDTVDKLADYICNEETVNLFALDFASIGVTNMFMDPDNYYVMVSGNTTLSLDNPDFYSNVESVMLDKKRKTYDYLLGRLGYSEKEIDQIIANCYKLEADLSDHIKPDSYYQKWFKTEESLRTTSMDEIREMEGNYPLTRMLEASGYDSGSIILMNPAYISYIGKLFNEKNLNMIKAYLIVNTLDKVKLLLDRECIDELCGDSEQEELNPDDGAAKYRLSDEESLLLQTSMEYLIGDIDALYVANYCTVEEKEDVSQLTDMIIEEFRTIIQEEEWLSDETKEQAVIKLDHIARNILYPETAVSYEYLDLQEGKGLLELVADICKQKKGHDAVLLGQEPDPYRWDYEDIEKATTIENCSYFVMENSINIFAGFLSDPKVYSIDMPIEEKLAKIGTVIGHEITHAFDSNGAQYDENGKFRDWWTKDDKTNYKMRTNKLKAYFSAITPYPGGTTLNGDHVKGEAVADIGGVKGMLAIAKDIEGFDYKAFFEYYAELWRSKYVYSVAQKLVTDVHPLDNLRVNVTVMQFDEFMEQFDVKQGDGMYLSTEERICVW